MGEKNTVAHTPGPWSWTNKYSDSQGRETWTLVGEDGYGILSCDGVGNSPQCAGNGADVSMIAAAPELLAFAQSIVEAESEGHMMPKWMARDARAAITKATGGAS